MSLLLDTGIVYAYYDRSDAWHARARAVLQRERQGLVLPAPTIPEIDHLLGTRLGPNARLAFYAGIVEGHYLVADLPSGSYPRVVELHEQFRPLAIGFVDAAVVALAEAMGIPRVATTDRRHFEPMAAPLGLRLMPEA